VAHPLAAAASLVASLIRKPALGAMESLAAGLIAALIGAVLTDCLGMRLLPHVCLQSP
jgi:uncharacterized membrane protein YdcZ (DUF606 family)